MARVTATVLFTDLVGSTEVRGRLGEDATDALRRRHDHVLARAVGAHGGQVVKGLGDGIMATFAGAADALAAAVAIQQAVDRLNRSGRTPVPLAVRIGLSAGDVMSEDGDVHGMPVIEASRLCAAADGEEILVSEVVRLLAGAAAASALAPRGALELKGLSGPVPAWEVRWDPTPASTIPMPALLTGMDRIFVGRDAEVERLGQLWKEAMAGERRVAFLAGEPGVGKTRLTAEFATGVHEEGATVLAGRCDEDMGVPYQPFVDALGQFVDHIPTAELQERLGRYGGELARLVPDLSERLPDLPPLLRADPETERYRLFDSVAAWLSAASTDPPLLLILDDLQWAARPTLLLLRHIVRTLNGRVLILGTYRDTELTHDHPLVELMADLRRDGTVERFPLSGLDDAAVTAIVEEAAGQTLDDDGMALAHAIHQETEGNPFFVGEVLRHLSETKVIEREAGCWRTTVPIAELGIPEGIRDVVGRRLSRLSDRARQALRMAAVVGAEFETELLRVAGELVESDVLAALDEAVQARLVNELSPIRFQFSHALVRATLYESLTGARKIALHRHVAEAIEALHERTLDDYLPALAHHWAKASAPATHTPKAVDYARRAGDRALAQLAHDEAAAYYRQGLELLEVLQPPDEQQRLGLLLALGEAERDAGQARFRTTLLSAARLARDLGDGGRVVQAALANYRGVVSAAGRLDAERVDVLETAKELVGSGDSAPRALVLATLAAELTFAGDWPGRRQLADGALAIARRLDDPATLARVLNLRQVATQVPETNRERLAETLENLQLTARLDNPLERFWALEFRLRATGEAALISESMAVLEELEELVGQFRQPTLEWFVARNRAWCEQQKGPSEQCERCIAEALRLGTGTGQPDAESIYAAQLISLRLQQGRLGELETMLSQLARDRPGLHALQAALARCYQALDRPHDAMSVLAPYAASAFASVTPDSIYSWTLAIFSEVCAYLQDRRAARVLMEKLQGASGLLASAVVVYQGPVDQYLGLLADTLGEFDRAESYFAAAASLSEQILRSLA